MYYQFAGIFRQKASSIRQITSFMFILSFTFAADCIIFHGFDFLLCWYLRFRFPPPTPSLYLVLEMGKLNLDIVIVYDTFSGMINIVYLVIYKILIEYFVSWGFCNNINMYTSYLNSQRIKRFNGNRKVIFTSRKR